MERNEYCADEPIAALATPWGQSALAVVRVSGPGCLGLLSRVCTAPLAEAPGHSLRRGRLIDGFSNTPEPIDEVLVAVYRPPRSFTGEEAAEIFTHGSPVILRRALDLLFRAGFRQAGPGEFTLRAFLNGKLDLTEAEAVNELVRARTDRARALALRRLSGSIEGEIRGLKHGLVQVLAAVEARLDSPEEELPGEELAWQEELDGLERGLERLAASYRIGRIYQEGVSAVLAGRTNSGKSTLFNRLLREERAIVSEAPGTTRDYIEGMIELEGIPVRLYDTAGYRSSADAVEQEGIRRTEEIVAGAQLVLYLVDSAEGLTELDRRFFQDFSGDGRLIRVWTKTDLGGGECPEGFLPVSAREGLGLAELARAMARRVLAGPGLSGEEAPVVDSLRQKELLDRALEAWRAFRAGLAERRPLDLAAVDLKEALDALGEITGEVTSQDILNAIFSRFCVGK